MWDPRQWLGLVALDPTGAAAHVAKWVPRYRAAAERRHADFLARWSAGKHDDALVELHFFLTAACRLVDFMKMTAKHLEADVKTHVESRDFSLMKDARNHFEHIEDRLFGTKKNHPKPMAGGGGTRTVHFGLRAADQHLTWSDKALDVSPAFLADFLAFVGQFEELVRSASAADHGKGCPTNDNTLR